MVSLTFEKNATCEMLIATQQDMKEKDVPITLIAAVTVPPYPHSFFVTKFCYICEKKETDGNEREVGRKVQRVANRFYLSRSGEIAEAVWI